jgi:hypothetical protein
MKMQEAALGPLRIRFYDSVGNGFHAVPRIGNEADPYKNVCKPSLRVHFHGKISALLFTLLLTRLLRSLKLE